MSQHQAHIGREQRVVRVFVSSTFRDMHGERDHLVTVVFPILRERLEQLGLEFFDVDLRWGVPQTGVDGELANSWAYCRQWIDRVEPFFISLLGERYGWMPPGEEIPDPAEREAYRGISITEMEIRHAVLGTRLRRSSYFYLRKQRVPEDADPEVRREFIDGEQAARLEDLKTRILASSRPVRFYPCRWSGAGFSDFEGFGQMVLEDIWSGVLRDERYVHKAVWREVLGQDPDGDPLYTNCEQTVPEGFWRQLVALAKPAPADPFELEALQMRAFAESRLRWFQGRQTELEQLDEFVHGELPEGVSRLAVVRASPGQGKSALLARFVEQLRGQPHWVFEHFVGATARSTEVHFLLDRLLHALDCSGIEWHEEDGGTPDLRRRISRRFANYRGDRRIVILVDGVDQLGFEWLPSALGPNVRIIVSCLSGSAMVDGSREAQVLAALQARVPEPRWVELEPLDPADVRMVVTGYLLEYCKQLDREQIDIICGMEQARNPLYLIVMLAELRTLGGNDMHRIVPRLIADLRRQRPDSTKLFAWVLERMEVFGVEAVRRFCAYLAVSRSGMSSRELSDLLALHLGEEGARAASRIERGLRRYLLRRGAGFDFFHGQLRQAAQRRYLQGADPAEYHRELARYFLSRGIEDDHALTELAWHLRCGQLTAELFALIDNSDFRRRRISQRAAMHDLCADIALALEAAMEANDTVHIARFGFLHAAYHEGRFGKQDVMELHLLDPPAALREAKLFRGLARFRLLVLLALRESAAGQTERAMQLVAEAAAIRGVKLPAADAPFLAGAVARLAEAGGPDALLLVPAVLPRQDGFRCALEAASRTSAGARPALLAAIVAWLDQDFRDPNGNHPIEGFNAAVQAVMHLEDDAMREELLATLAGTIDGVRTPLEVATDQQDTMGAIAILTTQMFHADLGVGKGRKEGVYYREDYVAILRAALGSALAVGQNSRGYQLLDQAVEACGEKASSVVVFQHVTQVLYRLHSPEAVRLLQRLVTKARGNGKDDQLGAMLDILASGAGREDLVEVLDAIGASLRSLPMTRRVRLLQSLARAYGAAGKRSLMRQAAKCLNLHLGQLELVRWNPLISAGSKFAVLRDTIENVARLGERDPAWTGAWIARLAKWTGGVASSAERIKNLIALLELAGECRVAAGVHAAFDVILAVPDEDLCANGIEAALDAAQHLEAGDRTRVQARSWQRAEQFHTPSAQAKIQRAWWRTAGTDEVGSFVDAAAAVRALPDPALRAEGLGQVAATLDRCGQTEAADRAWYDAGLADQDAAMGAMAFGARVAAATQAGDDGDWNTVLAAVACPETESAAKIVQIAALACHDPKRLAALQQTVQRLKWGRFEIQPLAAMHLAVARAWGSAGDPQRGAHLALHVLKRVRSKTFDEPLLADLIETSLVLQECANGRILLVSLVPFVFAVRNGDPNRLIELAAGLTRIQDDELARVLFTHLYWAALELNYSLPWKRVEVAAGIAEAMAERGQVDLAHRLLEHMPRTKQNEEPLEEFFGKASSALALGRLSHAYAKIYIRRPNPDYEELLLSTCSRALETAAEVKTDVVRKEACQAQILVWEGAVCANIPEQAAALAAAEANVRIATAGAISRWEGLTQLSLAWARLGEVGHALALAREISEDKARDEHLVKLAGVIWEKAPGGIVDSWREIATPAARCNAAWTVARSCLEQQVAQREEKPQPAPPPWPLPGHRSYLVAGGTAIAAAGYWLGWCLWPTVLAGLTGPGSGGWIAGLAGLALVSVKCISHAQRHDSGMENPLIRVGVSFLGLPFLPILLGVWLCNRRKATRPALRAWLYAVRQRLHPKERPPAQPAEPESTNDEPFRHLLWAAVEETEPFDLLLGAWIAGGHLPVQPSTILAALPEFRLPSEMSAKMRDQYRQYAEIERSEQWIVRFWEKSRSLISKTGIFLSIGLIYWPIAVWARWRMKRRKKRASKLAVKGGRLIGQNQAAKAVEVLKRAVELEPEIPMYWNDYSIALSRAGRANEGIDACRKACEIGRGSESEPQFWYGLGYELFQNGRYREALEAFERVLSIAKPGTQDYIEAEKGKGSCLTNLRLRS